MPIVLIHMLLNKIEICCPVCKGQLSEAATCSACRKTYPSNVYGTFNLIPFGAYFCCLRPESNDAVPSSHGSPKYDNNRNSLLRKAVNKLRDVAFGQNAATINNVKAIISSINLKPKILVVGGGAVGSGISAIYSIQDSTIISFDVYDSENVNVVADAHYMPFSSDQFDLVIAQAVLEHVLEPSVVIKEIYRVLKPHGLVYTEIPFLQPVHEGAYDFTRYTLNGHKWLLRDFSLMKAGALQGACTSSLMVFSYMISALFRARIVGIGIRVLLARTSKLIDKLIDSKWNSDVACGTYCLATKPDLETVPPMETLTAVNVVISYDGAQ
jgi:SAM-dependent methyltransferase